MSLYEQAREERIKENLQRLQKLGLLDLSQKLYSLASPKPNSTRARTRGSPNAASASSPSGPLRRSSRLQNVTPVTYSEVVLPGREGLLVDKSLKRTQHKTMNIEEWSKPEVYTEEHEKLLGNTERSWTLFVDGCGKDGKRIYDPINGKTCHQCRQKTLGYRTHCSECKMVQGQFCGDCLYMRYGEHVLEALENPSWICPVCRGICNCSLCRQAKGWPPTGLMYRRISSLGYKSVAHYLFQTRRSQNDVKEMNVTVNEASAVRSLPFSDTEAASKESSDLNAKQCGISKPRPNNSKCETQMLANGNPATDGQSKMSLQFASETKELAKVEHDRPLEDNMLTEIEFKGKMQMLDDGHPADDDGHTKGLILFQTSGISSKNVESAEVKHQFEDKKANDFDKEEDKEWHSAEGEHDGNIALQSCQKLKRKYASALEPSPDSVAARLMQRRRSNGHSTVGLMGSVKERGDLKQPASGMLSEEESNQIGMHFEDKRHAGDGIALTNCTKLKKKPSGTNGPSLDSIGGRLRLRRRIGK